jgi:SHS2 domain-containing protein
MPFKELPHTSDLYLEITGTSLNNLFEEAAKGMFCKLGKGKGDKKVVIDVEAPDMEQLLVTWLENLLIEHEMTGNLFMKFKVKIEGNKLHGEATGGPGRVHENIKGVTFFNLKIEQEKTRFKVRVLFDI